MAIGRFSASIVAVNQMAQQFCIRNPANEEPAIFHFYVNNLRPGVRFLLALKEVRLSRLKH
jgi:hypothetical protein